MGNDTGNVCIKKTQKLIYTTDGLELLKKPCFWDLLVKLYLLNYPVFTKLFNLQDYNQNKIPQTLLIAIYYRGYKFHKNKPPKLTEYMERLFDLNFKKIISRPSLYNLYALYIYMDVYFGNGKIPLSRACLAHISKMSYMFGIHIDSNHMHESLNLDRKNLFHQISFYDLTLSGTFNLTPRYIAELPEFDSRLNQPSSYLTLKELLETKNQDYDLNNLNAKLNSLKSIYDSMTMELMHFDFITSIDDAALEHICITRFSLLDHSYTVFINSLNQLKYKYSRYTSKIENFEHNSQSCHFYVALVILEYGRVNQVCLSDALLRKTIKICDGLYTCIIDSDIPDFYCYLVCFTYLSILSHFDTIEQDIILSRVNSIFKTLSPSDEFNNLNYLMLTSALKIIKK